MHDTNSNIYAAVGANGPTSGGVGLNTNAAMRIVDTVPNSVKSSFNLDEEDEENSNKLTFESISLSGTYTESDMSKFGYVVVVLPSGITHPKMAKTEFNEDMNRVLLSVQMPQFLTNSFLLHKHTFPDGGVSLVGNEREVATNLRITTYNKLLDSIGYKRGGSPLWYHSTIVLPEPSCSKKFHSRKYLKCNKSGCLVLFIEYLIEASNFEEQEEEFDIL